jgi:thiamine pyrophosphate-dependent acetolactate synthase large subunit-like protein
VSRLPTEKPAAHSAGGTWGSDRLADVLRELGVDFVALNPGSSFRGLHDSLVNHLGNDQPQLLLCLHEEQAVAIAHGYAKVTDRAMAVALHSNVGLMHASMALFNAFCDRVPMLVVGATGPLDAARRRPWIDWLHTATDQAALVRPFLKWDDQPQSVAAATEALMQAHRLTMSSPRAPTYVCLDTSIQEGELSEEAPAVADVVRRFEPAGQPAPDPAAVEQLAQRLTDAPRVVLLVGRTTRSPGAWRARIELAERLAATVFTHHKLPAAFPTSHPLHVAPPQGFVSRAIQEAVRGADVIVALDWLDLGGTLAAADCAGGFVASITLDDHLHHGWGKESMRPVAADMHIQAGADLTVDALLRTLGPQARPPRAEGPAPSVRPSRPGSGALVVENIADALRAAIANGPACLVRTPLSWSGGLWEADDPLDVLGGDGGEGVGSGPGMTVGAALALRDRDRLVVSVLGDGDYLMGLQALWTAAHYRLALLIVVANNRSYFNDEVHQHRVAVRRERPAENRWIGQRIADPEPDLAALARSLGLVGYGPVTTIDALAGTLAQAVALARDGQAVVVDVHIESTVEGDDARAAGQSERG